MTDFRFEMFNNQLNSLGIIEGVESAQFKRVEFEVGDLTLEVAPDLPLDFYQTFNIIEVHRRTVGAFERYRSYILLNTELECDDKGIRYKLECLDSNVLLEWRQVAHYKGTPEAQKTGLADDVAKAYVAEAMQANTAAGNFPDRDWTGFVTSAPNTGQALGTIDRDFSWRDLLSVVNEISEENTTQTGQYMTFDMTSPNVGEYEFQTYVDQLGVDRRGDFLNLTVQSGTLSKLVFSQDALDARTVVYALGPGEGVNRLIATAQSAFGIGASRFGWRETSEEAKKGDSAASLQGVADDTLRDVIGRQYVDANFSNTSDVLYGREIDFGDIINVTVVDFYRNMIDFPCRIDAEKIKISGRGGVDISVKLRSLTT